MPSTSSGITLFQAQNPSLFLLSQIYVPGVEPNLTVSPPTGNVIPVVGCLLIDSISSDILYVVTAVDPITYATTYVPAQLAANNSDPNSSQVSLLSYGNDIFRVYYDPRTNPVTVIPDTRLVTFGNQNASYQIVLNPGPNQTIISQYYNQAGVYLGNLVPLVDITSLPILPGTTEQPVLTTTGKYCLPCYTNTALTDGQQVAIQIFNSQGAQTAQWIAFAKESVIANEFTYTIPTISSMTITSVQSRSNNEIYIYQNQNTDSLGLQVELTYTDGTVIQAPIDNTQCFVYGLSDFVSSYPGLRQNILVKYYLSSEQVATPSLLNGQTFITAEASLVVISNNLSYGVKISSIPVWDASINQYQLNFFMYNTNRSAPTNVTGLVSYLGANIFSGSTYGSAQYLTLGVDLNAVDPISYPVSTQYQQNLVLTLQPLTSTVRYIIADSSNATIVYGTNSVANPRPQLYFDQSTNMYVVNPVFNTQALFLTNFYTNANPPYDSINEVSAPTPTHFQVKDPSTGIAVTTAPIPMTQYQAEFAITANGNANRYAQPGSNLVVEFLLQLNNNTTLFLYGVPVDVISQTSVTPA